MAAAIKAAKRQAKAAAKQMSSKNDPQLAALSRELRDPWLEEMQRDEAMLSLPGAARK